MQNTREGRVLITEKCDKDLQEYIKQSNGLGEAAVKDFLQQIGLLYECQSKLQQIFIFGVLD